MAPLESGGSLERQESLCLTSILLIQPDLLFMQPSKASNLVASRQTCRP